MKSMTSRNLKHFFKSVSVRAVSVEERSFEWDVFCQDGWRFVILAVVSEAGNRAFFLAKEGTE